jgi:hypothetical protein
MLTPILATDDPYEAAAVFVRAGWSLIFQTPADSDDPLTIVELADVFGAHRDHADSVTDLARRPWGELAFTLSCPDTSS